MTQPAALNHERYITTHSDSGLEVKIRVYCIGPGFSDASPITTTSILIEVGGGSSAYDLIGL